MSAQIKNPRSNTRNKVWTTSEIGEGELAISIADQKLYSANATGIFEIGEGFNISDLESVEGPIGTIGTRGDITTSGDGADIVAHRGNIGAGGSGIAKTESAGNVTVSGYAKVGSFSNSEISGSDLDDGSILYGEDKDYFVGQANDQEVRLSLPPITATTDRNKVLAISENDEYHLKTLAGSKTIQVAYEAAARSNVSGNTVLTSNSSTNLLTVQPPFLSDYKSINTQTGVSGQYNVIAEKNGVLQRDALWENFVGTATESPSGSQLTLINRGTNHGDRRYGFRKAAIPDPTDPGIDGSRYTVLSVADFYNATYADAGTGTNVRNNIRGQDTLDNLRSSFSEIPSGNLFGSTPCCYFTSGNTRTFSTSKTNVAVQNNFYLYVNRLQSTFTEISTFKIQVSSDGTTWRTLHTITESDAPENVWTLITVPITNLGSDRTDLIFRYRIETTAVANDLPGKPWCVTSMLQDVSDLKYFASSSKYMIFDGIGVGTSPRNDRGDVKIDNSCITRNLIVNDLLYVTGNRNIFLNAISAPAFNTTSDERLKDVDSNIENAVDKVKKLRGIYFKYNADMKGVGYHNNRQIGLIAQDVEKVVPEVVSESKVHGKDDDEIEYKHLQYDRLVPLLVEAIKEQQIEIESLKKSIQGQE